MSLLADANWKKYPPDVPAPDGSRVHEAEVAGIGTYYLIPREKTSGGLMYEAIHADSLGLVDGPVFVWLDKDGKQYDSPKLMTLPLARRGCEAHRKIFGATIGAAPLSSKMKGR